MTTRCLVVAARHQLHLVQKMSALHPDMVIIWRSRDLPIDMPRVLRVEDAVSAGARQAVFLTPSTTLARDVAHCRHHGVDVIAAGPIPQTSAEQPYASPRRQLDGAWLHDMQWKHLQTARLRPAFGKAVFYRRVSGGGSAGVLWTWWALWHGLAECVSTLSRPDHPAELIRAQLNVTRIGPRRRWHATLHAQMADGASAQIVVTPQPDAQHVDRLLVGSGGSISTEALDTGTYLMDSEGRRQSIESPDHPMLEWMRHRLVFQQGPADKQNSDSEPQLPDSDMLLKLIRRAARDGTTVAVV